MYIETKKKSKFTVREFIKFNIDCLGTALIIIIFELIEFLYIKGLCYANSIGVMQSVDLLIAIACVLSAMVFYFYSLIHELKERKS